MSIKLKVHKIEEQTDKCKAFYFNKPESFSGFISGQFLTFIINIDNQEYRRCYSLCTHPSNEELLGIAVKRVQAGMVSNYLNDTVNEGDTLEVELPSGRFNYHPSMESTKQLFLVAGGSGITPVLSILKTALADTTDVKVTMLYVNENESEVIFKKELDSMQSSYAQRFKLIHYLNAEHQKVGKTLFGKKKVKDQGFIDENYIADLVEEQNFEKGFLTYICGPEGFMNVTEKALVEELEIDSEKIKKEKFTSGGLMSGAEVQNKGIKTSVTITLDGNEHTFETLPGRTILESALLAGVRVPHSCREGHCTSCYGTCESGNVEMLTTESLTTEELAEKAVLPCVGFALSDDIKIKYN